MLKVRKLKIRQFLPALSLSLLLMPALSLADASTDLAARLKAIRSLDADFTQITQATKSKPESVVLGHIQAQKPGQFRWEVRRPYAQLLVSDGRELKIFDPDLQQMTIRPVSPELSQTPALLFAGNASALQQQFRISQKKNGASVIYVLTPKAKDAVFADLSLQFKGNEPLSMSLRDSLGQQTRIEFFRVKRNAALPAAAFKFTPPPGTDIIRE
ncbi:MAG: outer membrane lipoprotein chaperone LolA [Pseudomonadota bacterium]